MLISLFNDNKNKWRHLKEYKKIHLRLLNSFFLSSNNQFRAIFVLNVKIETKSPNKSWVLAKNGCLTAHNSNTI